MSTRFLLTGPAKTFPQTKDVIFYNTMTISNLAISRRCVMNRCLPWNTPSPTFIVYISSTLVDKITALLLQLNCKSPIWSCAGYSIIQLNNTCKPSCVCMQTRDMIQPTVNISACFRDDGKQSATLACLRTTVVTYFLHRKNCTWRK